MGSSKIIDQLKKNQILELLKEGKRIDGRALDEVRELTIDVGVIPKAEGSARARLGDTEVVAGVKVQPERPFPDTGDQGMLICTAEILPIAHNDVETGPPGPPVVELARVTDRGIRESKMLDMKQLVLEKNKSVIGVFCDNAVTDHDGNLFDACSYATTAAINSCKIPKYEMKDDAPVKIENEFDKPPISTLPVSVTMAKIGDYIIVDPNFDEWSIMDARITITTNSDGNVVALQKGGQDGFTQDNLIKCAEISIRVGSKIRDIIKESSSGVN
ncbi:MAG: exosome complex protein Rrp42 [Candidatus Nitrosopelagicus sp.]|jgi:exosome complex component RRP42|nr:exosome complex protein Rrp42 [Candidatus Nitrosopelagicus sp.]